MTVLTCIVVFFVGEIVLALVRSHLRARAERRAQ